LKTRCFQLHIAPLLALNMFNKQPDYNQHIKHQTLRVAFLPQMEESFAYLPFIVLPFIQRLQWLVKAAGCFDGFSNLAVYVRYYTSAPSGLGLWLGGRAAWSLQSTSEFILAKTSASQSHKKMQFKIFYPKTGLAFQLLSLSLLSFLDDLVNRVFVFFSFRCFFQWCVSKVKIALKRLIWNTPFIFLF